LRREFGKTISWPSLAPADWSLAQSRGHRASGDTIGEPMVVFTDYECPACQRFETSVLPAVRRRYGDQFQVVYRHLPLSIHPHAVMAAVAAECAAQQGRFEEMHRVLFQRQSEFAREPWVAFASTAGVSDVDRFSGCLASQATKDIVANDAALAREMGISATPTLLLRGTRIPSISSVHIDSAFRHLPK